MNNSHDPLAVLHGDDLPVQPDPAFAARLRSRLETALSMPNRTQGVVMSGTDTAIAELSEPAADPQARPTVPRSAAVPYLTVATRATPSPGMSTRWARSSSANRS